MTKKSREETEPKGEQERQRSALNVMSIKVQGKTKRQRYIKKNQGLIELDLETERQKMIMT